MSELVQVDDVMDGVAGAAFDGEGATGGASLTEHAASMRRAVALVMAGGPGMPDARRMITPPNGKEVMVMAPSDWSDNAVAIIKSKYMRRKQVPSETVEVEGFGHLPAVLRPRRPAPGATFGGETSAEQVFHRLAGCWTHWMCLEMGGSGKAALDPATAVMVYEAIKAMLRRQMMAPNSPQWFNTGLHWAYGIAGQPGGQYHVDPATGEVVPSTTGYEFPQVHACFISSVNDDLVRKGGIFDFMHREARIFRDGSGSGANFSRLRGKNETLTGGGNSSGLMSFLRPLDAAAGSIKSGGTTRRAAKMVTVDADHPEVEDLIEWKSVEERKVAALVTGSEVNARHGKAIHAAILGGGDGLREMARARKDGVLPGFIAQVEARALQGIPVEAERYDLDWQGAAYGTVSGQNSNNSIRMPDELMEAVEGGRDWTLLNRVDGSVAKTMPAVELWDKINLAAYTCADPGLQFGTEVNRWNTCPNDGEIRGSNPCSEYFWLDDTGCNLASLRLTKYRTPGGYDVALLAAAAEITQSVLDVSVDLGQYPAEEIAANTWKYRTTGLGFADIGGLLMRMGIPYDSDLGRDVAGAIMSTICSTAYLTSARMAGSIGAFPRHAANAEPMAKVIGMHRDAHAQQVGRRHRGGSEEGYALLREAHAKATANWDEAVARGARDGFRNAQVCVIAPTGTIGLVMDVDTTGIEPEFAMKKWKVLAGGGGMEIVNGAIHDGLYSLGYEDGAVEAIVAWVAKNDGLDDCTAIDDEDRAVFDTANRNGGGTRFLRPEAHVLMMAAVQPFVSGAISKTVNMPSSSTLDDVKRIHMLGWKLRLKAMAIYRDGCKLSQPLNAKRLEAAMGELEAEVAGEAIASGDVRAVAGLLAANVMGRRVKLPSKRGGHTQKATVGGHRIYIRTGQYPDGRLGEVFLDMHKEGAAFRSIMNCFAQAISIGLQYGVPLEEYVDAYTFVRFEPSGPVQDHDRIKTAMSVIDYVFRHLAIDYLGRDDLAHAGAPQGSHAATDIGGGHDEGKVKAPADAPATPSAALAVLAPTPATPLTAGPVALEESHGKYTGDTCQACGSARMVRSGTCLRCEECNDAGGCG